MTQQETKHFRVAILDDFEKLADTVPAYEKLKARADIAILRERLDSPEKIARALKEMDALLLMRERTFFIDNEYRLLPNLKFISQTGRTSRHLDLPSATRHGIAVAGTPADNGTSTKELTVALILALMRKIPEVDRRMREESWPPVAGRLLEGKTVGVLGLGRIGKEVARVMKVLNTRVLGYSRTLTPAIASEVGAEYAPMETLLKESDIVTLHVQLTTNTRGMIGAKEFDMMKPGALLVNTSRGPLVNESALVAALERGHLGGVGLDVFDVEPLPLDHPLRRFDSAILLSHRGYATVEVMRERYEEAITNILSFLDGRPLNLLNPEVLNR